MMQLVFSFILDALCTAILDLGDVTHINKIEIVPFHF